MTTKEGIKKKKKKKISRRNAICNYESVDKGTVLHEKINCKYGTEENFTFRSGE